MFGQPSEPRVRDGPSRHRAGREQGEEAVRELGRNLLDCLRRPAICIELPRGVTANFQTDVPRIPIVLVCARACERCRESKSKKIESENLQKVVLELRMGAWTYLPTP